MSIFYYHYGQKTLKFVKQFNFQATISIYIYIRCCPFPHVSFLALHKHYYPSIFVCVGLKSTYLFSYQPERYGVMWPRHMQR